MNPTGDPLRYHSHFVAQTLLPSSGTSSASTPVSEGVLRPMEIVAHGRLGTATKKAHLLCAWEPPSETAPADGDDNNGSDGNASAGAVEYWSVEWAGFG